MSKSNKNAKNEMFKLYGKKCFIEELHIRSDEEIKEDLKRYKGKKQLKIMTQLTYHHIVEKFKGGKATVENGAILRNINHIWFNRLSKEEQDYLNNLFQLYKKNFNCSLNIATLTTEGIEEAKKIDICFDDIDREDAIIIPVETMSEEEMKLYNKHKEERNKKMFKKFEEFEK